MLNECQVSEVILNETMLNDKAGGKLISSLVQGLSKGDHGYEKITSLRLAQNDLGKSFTTALKHLHSAARLLLWLSTAPASWRMRMPFLGCLTAKISTRQPIAGKCMA